MSGLGRLVAQLHRAEWAEAQEKAVQLMKAGQAAIWRNKSGFKQEVVSKVCKATCAEEEEFVPDIRSHRGRQDQGANIITTEPQQGAKEKEAGTA